MTILALVVAVAMQLDSAALIRRLSVDKSPAQRWSNRPKRWKRRKKFDAAQKDNPADTAAEARVEGIAAGPRRPRSPRSSSSVSPALNLPAEDVGPSRAARFGGRAADLGAALLGRLSGSTCSRTR